MTECRLSAEEAAGGRGTLDKLRVWTPGRPTHAQRAGAFGSTFALREGRDLGLEFNRDGPRFNQPRLHDETSINTPKR